MNERMIQFGLIYLLLLSSMPVIYSAYIVRDPMHGPGTCFVPICFGLDIFIFI